MRTGTRASGREAARSARRRTFWLLARQEGCRMEVLSVAPADGEEALPVFSFREEAEMFLGLASAHEGERGNWRVRQTGCGELISLLLDPCRRIERVALDPLPGGEAGPPDRSSSMRRGRFVGFVLNRRAGGVSGEGVG